MKWMKRAGTLLWVGVLVYLIALAGFAFAMRQPFDRFALLMAKTGPAAGSQFPST